MSKTVQRDESFKTSVTVARHGGIAITGSIVSSLVRFITQVILGRALGTEKYGLYSLGFSLFTIAGQVSQLGLPDSVIKFGVAYSVEKDHPRLVGMFRLAILLAVLVGLIVAVIMFLFAPYIAVKVFHKSELTIVLKFFAVAVPFYVFAFVASSLARAMQQIVYYTVIQSVLHPVIYMCIIALLWLTGLSIGNAVGAFICGWILISIYSVVVIIKIYPFLCIKIKPIYEIKKLFRFTIPVFLAKCLSLIINQCDKIILGKMVLASDLGIYNAGAKIAGQTVLFMQAFNLIFAPIIAELYHSSKLNELNSLFKTVTNWTVSLTLPIIIWIIIFAEPIMGIFGAEFIAGKNILILCCLAQFISVCTGPLDYILTMIGKQDLNLINNLVFGIINVFVNIYLVKKYGILGAVWALSISLLIINLVRLIEVYILHRLYPYSKKFINSIWAGFIASSSTLMLNSFLPFGMLNWLAASIFLFISYVLFLYLTDFDDEDRAILALIRRKVGSFYVKNKGTNV